jgi:hypothetical protein
MQPGRAKLQSAANFRKSAEVPGISEKAAHMNVEYSSAIFGTKSGVLL